MNGICGIFKIACFLRVGYLTDKDISSWKKFHLYNEKSDMDSLQNQVFTSFNHFAHQYCHSQYWRAFLHFWWVTQLRKNSKNCCLHYREI
jgi:hypothetical protein